MSLNWLSINARIEYKLSVIYHSFFLGLSSIYLSDPLLVYTPNRNLYSSSDNRIICISKLRTKTYGHRSLSFAAPTIWNSLPLELRHTDSIQKSKLALKTLLHRKLYTIHLIFHSSMWTTTFDPMVPEWDCVTVKDWFVRIVILLLLFNYLLLLLWSIRLHVPVSVRECTIDHLL